MLYDIRMKTMWLASLLVITFAQIGLSVQPSVEPKAEKYFVGQVSRDITAALQRGKMEHKPVWIVAWDVDFFHTTEGKTINTGDYWLRYFYENPETKKLVAKNFIQAFTTLKNPAISQWIDPSDVTHVPVYIVIDADGNLLLKKRHASNAIDGLKHVQEVVASLK